MIYKVVLIAYTLILSLGLLVEARTNIKSILEEKVSYEVAIEAVRKIAMSGMFEQQSSEEENNIRYLEKKMEAYKAGRLKVEEHELIEE